jgi:4-hydroxybutyryl-CoA dehydratase/vinylacetyl-CoA-Delta-isomerase
LSLRTFEQYVSALRDSREVYYRGKRVEDVTEHAQFSIAIEHAGGDFRLADDVDHRALAVEEEADGSAFSYYYHMPGSTDDLLRRSRLIETATAQGNTLVLLIKEIGTDALFAMTRVLGRSGEREGVERLAAFYRKCRDEDLALAVAQTDVKGDRSQGPAQQVDPDLHVRVVDRRPDGIVVRGAKMHTSCTPYVDEVLVIPGRSMSDADRDWSFAFAVPVATPGLRLYASDFLHHAEDPFTEPISWQHKMIETLTVFDDVFVPWERVFFVDRPDLAGQTALTFVEYHRFTAVSYKLPLVDALVGSAIAAAQANGIHKAAHVRDKLTWLAGYAETVRGLTHLAAIRCGFENDLAFPDVLTTNLAKWVFARDFHQAVHHVQDIAGGLLVTGPSGADWRSPEIRPTLEKYFKAAWPADRRLAILNLISDLTARSFAGYQAVLAVHAEGSIEAEKLALSRAYNPGRALDLTLRMAGLDA